MKNSFKFADLFPIHKGDLCKISDDANQTHKVRYGENDTLFGKTLLALSEPYNDEYDNSKKVIDVFIQEDAQHATMFLNALHKILVI